MNILRNFTGIIYCPRDYDSSGMALQKGDDNEQLSNTESRAQQKNKENDQICLTRLGERGVETVSTGATQEMVDKLIQGSATAEDKEKVKGMLETAVGQDVCHLSEKELGMISRLLELSGNIEGIKKILASEDAEWIVGNLVYVLTESYPELLNNKDITTELWKQIVSLNENPYFVLNALGGHPDLLKCKKLTIELWGQMFSSRDPSKVLLFLAEHPELLNHEKITTELLSRLLSSGCWEQIESLGLFVKIMKLREPSDILIFLVEHSELLKNEKLLFAHWSKMLSKRPNECMAILDLLVNHLELLKNEKITSDFLAKIIVSVYSSQILKALVKYPELLENQKLTDCWGNIPKLKCQRPGDVLMVLGKYTELLNHEKISIKLLNQILSQSLACEVLIFLEKNPALLNHEKITTELLGRIVSKDRYEEVSKMLMRLLNYEQIKSELLSEILSSSDAFKILCDLDKHSMLLKNQKITTELWCKILLYRFRSSLLESLVESLELLKSKKITTELLGQILLWSGNPSLLLSVLRKDELLKNDKITTELLSQILLLGNSIAVLKALAEHPSLAEHPELLKNEILIPALVSKILAFRILDPILASQDPLGVLVFMGKYSELLNSKKMTAKLWKQILISSDPVYVLESVLKALEKNTELLNNEVWWALASLFKLPSSFVDKILASKDPGGILDVLRIRPQLLNNGKLTLEFLDKIAGVNDPSGMLKSLDTCLIKYPDIFLLDMTADTFGKLAEKLIFLILKEDSRVNGILAQINKQVSIEEVEIQLNNIIHSEIDFVIKDLNALKEVSDPIFFQLERSKKVAQLLINESGELNILFIDLLKEKMPKSASPAHDKEFNETLDNLKNNREVSSLLTSINCPADPRNKANVLIRATLQLGVEAPLSVQHVRQAVLSALLMDLRQSATGSCFITGVAIRIHSIEQERFLQDMKVMIETGYATRFANGIEYKLFWSTIPSEEIGFERLSFENEKEKENVLVAIRTLGYTLSEAEEIYNYCYKTNRECIEELVANKLGITQEAISERRTLEGLVKPDEKSIPILSSRINLIDAKFDEFDKLVNYAEACYTSVSHNLLLRAWEYGLGAAGSRTELPFFINECNQESQKIYQLLWGGSTQKSYGIDIALNSLIDQTLRTNKSFSDYQGSIFKHALSEGFKRRFGKLFAERVKQQYQYGGFSLYDKGSKSDLNETQMISALADPLELQDLIARLVLETGFDLRKDFGKQNFELVIKIVERLSQHVRSEEFLEHFIRGVSAEVEKEHRIKLADKMPEIKDLKVRFRELIEGGQPATLLQIYYESPDIKPVSFVAGNAENLLVHLITEVRKLNIDKDQKILVPISGGKHLYLLMPSHPSFRSAIDSDLEPKEWVKHHVREQDETIVFADSNWEKDGIHRMFAINKNEKGDIVFSTVDETGREIAGGIDSLGVIQASMKQAEWVNNQTFELWVGLT